MAAAGMNILLINLSMTPRDICQEVIKYARELDKECEYERVISIAMDMTAAPVRTGIFEGVCACVYLDKLMFDRAHRLKQTWRKAVK